MPLYTKSVQAMKRKSDGVRICIMRRPGQETDWDIWMPRLSPSHKLLTEYHQNQMSWDEYCRRFRDEVLDKENEQLQILVDISRGHKVTLLCWEELPAQCHRRLVAEECKKIDPNLEVVIR